MPYSPEQLEQMRDSLDDWMDREDDLNTALIIRAYRTDQGGEYAKHGFCRRIRMLRHAIDRVFAILPPEEERPGDGAIHDAELYVQAFIANVFGSIDNIARVLCAEMNIVQSNGAALPKEWIGLRAKNTAVRDRLSKPFQDALSAYANWFAYLEDYRHALAHKIPLYIPRQTLSDEDTAEFQRLEDEIAKTGRDHMRRGALLVEQRNLGTFKPLMMHSFYQPATPMWVHPQMICDFSSIVDLGEHMLRELNGNE